jgi:hemoglobin
MFLWTCYGELIKEPLAQAESRDLSVRIPMVEENEVFEAIGEDGFARLIRHFYSQVPADPVLGPMYPSDLLSAEERLRSFLIYRFGGPARYIEERGHPRLRMRHAPFPVDDRARQHWLLLMHNALEHAELPVPARDILWAYFESTAAAMKNQL